MRAGLLVQKDFPELLMFTEPELSLRPRSERFAEGFLRAHLGSLECRVRNDHAKCSSTDERDSNGNDRSDRDTHVDPPFYGEARACPCRYKYSALSNKPVTHVTARANFLLTTLHNRRIAG
jgi:hypothetical protein